MNAILLSHPIGTTTPLYGGRNKVEIVSQNSMERWDTSNSVKLMTTNHASTHIDLPRHFLKDGKTLSDYNETSWIFQNILIVDFDVSPGDVIDLSRFTDLQCDPRVDLLILKTGFEQYRGHEAYIHQSPVIASSLAAFLKEKFPKLQAIGFDTISLSSLTDREEGRRAHREFLGRDIRIIEDMKLSALTGTPDWILVSPLLIEEADGAPASVWSFYHPFDWRHYDDFFFDFDGVLVDSVDIKAEAFGEIYRDYGQEISSKVAQHHKDNGGMSRYEKFRYYHQEYLGHCLSQEELDSLCVQFSKIVFDKILQTRYIPGALEFLDMCQHHQKRCFVVSATPDSEIKKILREKTIAHYFHDVKGSPTSKVHNVRSLIQQYNVNVQRALFFGDAHNDLYAARLNRVPFSGMNYTGVTQRSYKNFNELIAGDDVL